MSMNISTRNKYSRVSSKQKGHHYKNNIEGVVVLDRGGRE